VPYKLPKFSIGLKIYGLSTSILILLIGVATVNTLQMQNVNRDISAMVDFTLVLKQHMTIVNTQVLQQEIHFERALKHYEIKSKSPEDGSAEFVRFKQSGQIVDQAFDQSIKLANQAVQNFRTPQHLSRFASLIPVIQILEEDHHDFQDQSLTIMNLIKSGQVQEARLLDQELFALEQRYEKRLHGVLFALEQFNENLVLQIKVYEQTLLHFNLQITAIAIFIGLMLSVLVTSQLVQPVKHLIQGAQAVDQGDLEANITVSSGDEFEVLAISFNHMVQGIRQKEQLKNTFGQYIDPRIVETLIEQQIDPREQRAEITVFCSDLAKFSTVSEMLTPLLLVSFINQYFTLATRPITELKGIIDKFIGDAIVAFWGPPFVSASDHAKFACFAALEQLSQLKKLQQMLPDLIGIRKGLPVIKVRVGLDTGELVVGNVGTEHFKAYTAMGQAVTTAEQLEGLSKRYGTTILITERTRVLAGDAIETREIDLLPMGRDNTSVRIYELLDYGGSLSTAQVKLRTKFEEGLAAYRQQNWQIAQAAFESCLQTVPEDGPSHYYLQQIKLQTTT
jgi:adenylate cyclase